MRKTKMLDTLERLQKYICIEANLLTNLLLSDSDSSAKICPFRKTIVQMCATSNVMRSQKSYTHFGV